MFKTLILGQGRYGTVWLSIKTSTSEPIAIKSQNNGKDANSFKKEIILMQKLKNYKIFTNLYDKLIINHKFYLVETLHCSNLEKLKKFCVAKFLILTTYKIGIELLQLLKYIHEAWYIYLDIKVDNIALLYESKKNL